MKNSTRFKPGESGCPSTMWPKGQSGNPVGKSRARRQFEEALADALAGPDPAARAQELADLLWTAARKGEAWAITLLLARLAPEPVKFRVEVARGADEFDFSRLTDQQIEQLETLFEQVAGPTGRIEAGEGPAPAP